MITFETPELQTAEPLKGFEKPDDLGKAYLELHGRAASGSIELLPEELRKDPTIANYKTVPDVAKALIETKKLVGSIKRPPADASGYKFTAIEGLDPSVKPDAGFQKVLAENALKMGLAEDQADGVHKIALGYVNQLVLQQRKTQEEQFKKNDALLRQEWGAEYDKNFNSVVRMLTKAGGDEVGKELGAAIQKAPTALKALARISSLLSEDSIDSLGAGDGGAAGEASAIEKEYQEYATAISTNDSKHPIMSDNAQIREKAVKRWGELCKEKFKEK